MTREEAITQLDLLLEYCESMMTSEYPVWRRDCEALQMLIAALRPISREQVEADNDGRCVVLPFLPPKVMWSCSKRQPKPAKSFYASEIGILADMKAGCVFGETPEEAEAALTNKENHVKK